jgi:hypothetical protein
MTGKVVAGFSGVSLVLAVCACIGLGTLASGRLMAAKGELPPAAELALFPSGRFLREVSLGHRHLVSDIAWLTAIQYYGKHRLGDRRYPLAPQLFAVLIDADEGFEKAYLFGSLVMAEAGFMGKGEQLLERGVAANPDSWKLRFELGFFRYVYTRAWGAAAEAFAAAAAIRSAPEYVVRFAESGDPCHRTPAAGETCRRGLSCGAGPIIEGETGWTGQRSRHT